MGCSNPHPHGQFGPVTFIPNEVALKLKKPKELFGQNIVVRWLMDYAQKESMMGARTQSWKLNSLDLRLYQLELHGH